MWYVYHISKDSETNLAEGYIGVTQNIEDRWKGHIKNQYKIGRAIRKYDLTIDNLKIINQFDNSDSAYDLEKQLRPGYNLGWNILPGGHGFSDGHVQDAYMRAKMSASAKRRKVAAQSSEHYKKIAEQQRGIKREIITCPFCFKAGGMGNMQRWHLAKCKLAPVQNIKINGYDFDGVVSLGIRPWPDGVIITGRSFEEKSETLKFMSNRDIECEVFFSPHKFEEKTREKSGHHKGQTIWNLFCSGKTVQLFYEDDWIQYRIIESYIKKYALQTKLVWVNHGGLVELENVRRSDEI